MGFPDFRAAEVATLPEYAPYAPLCFDGDAVHIIGRTRWWYAPRVEGPFTGWPMNTRSQQSYEWRIWRTHHYGLVVLPSTHVGLHAVELPPQDAPAPTETVP
jgi:hypothetical protein